MNDSSLLGNPLGGTTGPVIGGRGPLFFVRDQVREPLYVLVPLHNPWRWKSRTKHVVRALNHFHESGAVIVLIEVAYNRREFVFADSGLDGTPANCGVLGTDNKFRHKYLGLRSTSEIWLKESSLNVAVQHLTLQHPDWQQIAWLDSDILFASPKWVGETIQHLQMYKFLQLFSQARDLSPDYELMPESYPHASGLSFVEAWKRGDILSDLDQMEQAATRLGEELDGAPAKIKADMDHVVRDVKKLEGDLKTYPYAPRTWPGIAWACSRQAFDEVGGLQDWHAWGGSDHVQSHALLGKTEGMIRPDLHPNYRKLVYQWYYKASTQIRRNVGCLNGLVMHNYHGSKQVRGYNKRHQLLAKFGFDPLRHLKHDSNGLLTLHDDRSTSFVQLRDMIRKVAFERREDDTHTGLEMIGRQGH